MKAVREEVATRQVLGLRASIVSRYPRVGVEQ